MSEYLKTINYSEEEDEVGEEWNKMGEESFCGNGEYNGRNKNKKRLEQDALMTYGLALAKKIEAWKCGRTVKCE